MSCFVLPTCSSAPHLRGILKTGGQRLTKQQLSSRFVPLSLISLLTLETWLCGRRHAQKEASKKPESLVLIDLESCHTDSVRFIRPSYQCITLLLRDGKATFPIFFFSDVGPAWQRHCAKISKSWQPITINQSWPWRALSVHNSVLSKAICQNVPAGQTGWERRDRRRDVKTWWREMEDRNGFLGVSWRSAQEWDTAAVSSLALCDDALWQVPRRHHVIFKHMLTRGIRRDVSSPHGAKSNWVLWFLFTVSFMFMLHCALVPGALCWCSSCFVRRLF